MDFKTSKIINQKIIEEYCSLRHRPAQFIVKVHKDRTGAIGAYSVTSEIIDSPITYLDVNGNVIAEFHLLSKCEKEKEYKKIIAEIHRRFPVEEFITQEKEDAMNYGEAIDRINTIEEGMSESQVIQIMGEPQEKSENSWHYDFQQLKGFLPPAVGRQTFFGGTVFFEKGKVSHEEKEWLDVTGEAPVNRYEIFKTDGFEGVIFPASYYVSDNICGAEVQGRWDPTEEDVRAAEKIIKSYIKKAAPDVYRKLSRYKRQYVGYINKKEEKIIWINCFISGEEDWDKDLIFVMDGGNDFFNVKVNLNTKQAFGFFVNGEA